MSAESMTAETQTATQSVQRQRPGPQGLHWPAVIGIGVIHLGCLAAPFTFSWSALGVVVFLYWLSGGLGIAVCFHRLLTHRSFKAPKWLEYLLTVFGCLAWQGTPIHWVGIHRLHHAHSDRDHDPHSPTEGFSWAHMLWMLRPEPDGQNAVDAARDLQRDPVHAWLHRYFWVPQVALVPILFVAGEWYGGLGLSWVVWGVFVRTTVGYHCTWLVNSATHTWGYRTYRTRDRSTNLWWVALITWGEGWHNNHHAFQRSARHGLRWYELDPTYLTIRILERLGLAWDLVLPSREQQAAAELA